MPKELKLVSKFLIIELPLWVFFIFFSTLETWAAPTVERRFEETRQKINLDGLKVASDTAYLHLLQLHKDATISLNGVDHQRRRTFHFPNFPSNQSFQYRIKVQFPDGSNIEHVTSLSAGRSVSLTLIMEHVREIVITKLLCIKQDGLIFPDRPQLNFGSDLTSRRNIQRNEMSTGQSWSINRTFRADKTAKLQLFDIDTFDPSDFLGTVNIDLSSKVRTGLFNNDPNGVGAKYRVTWRVEPDDTFAENLAKSYKNPVHKNQLTTRLQQQVNDAKSEVHQQELNTMNAINNKNEETQKELKSALELADAAQKRAQLENKQVKLNKQKTLLTEAEQLQITLEEMRKTEFKQKEQNAAASTSMETAAVKSQQMALKNTVTEKKSLEEQAVKELENFFGAIVPDSLKKAAKNAKSELKKAEEQLNKHKPKFEFRDKTWTEIEKRTPDFIEQVEKFGTALEKAYLPALRAWKEIAEILETTREELKIVGQQIQENIPKINAAKTLENGKKEAHKARRQIKTEADHAVERVKKEVKNAKETVQEYIDLLTAQEVIVYKINNDLNFALNTYTGSLDASIDLKFAGLQWDLEKTKQLMQGNFSFPEVDPIQLIGSSMGDAIKPVDNNKYQELRDKLMNESEGSVYYATERFVKWGGPETIVRLAAASIVDGGNQATQEAKQQLSSEYDEIFAWLSLRGEQEVQQKAASLLSAAFGAPLNLNLPEITVKPQTIPYEYKAELIGVVPLPPPVIDLIKPRLKSLIPVPTSEDFKVNHVGFAIEWKSGNKEQRHLEILENYEQNQLKGMQAASNAFQAVISEVAENAKINPQIAKLLKELSAEDYGQSHINEQIQNKILNELKISGDELKKWYVPEKAIIDLSNTPVAERFEKMLGKIALGNKGQSRLTRLEFNLETYCFSGKIEIIHQHSWGTLQGLLDSII